MDVFALDSDPSRVRVVRSTEEATTETIEHHDDGQRSEVEVRLDGDIACRYEPPLVQVVVHTGAGIEWQSESRCRGAGTHVRVESIVIGGQVVETVVADTSVSHGFGLRSYSWRWWSLKLGIAVRSVTVSETGSTTSRTRTELRP